jgi:hypothetical protein
MTPEEIQKTIEGMLAVQRELQNSQLKLQEESASQREDIARQREDISQILSVSRDLQEGQMQMMDALGRLIEVSNRHE